MVACTTSLMFMYIFQMSYDFAIRFKAEQAIMFFVVETGTTHLLGENIDSYCSSVINIHAHCYDPDQGVKERDHDIRWTGKSNCFYLAQWVF